MGMIDYLGRKPSRDALLRGEVPKWIANSPRKAYITAVILSAPPWVSLKELRAMQRRARWETEMHQALYVLDHIVPLNNPRVCGLTVPWNLQIVPWLVNARKSNDFCPEQLELSMPEQPAPKKHTKPFASSISLRSQSAVTENVTP
jgi:hypothetical protein